MKTQLFQKRWLSPDLSTIASAESCLIMLIVLATFLLILPACTGVDAGEQNSGSGAHHAVSP